MPLTFAYGSNMDWIQMSERCPFAQFVCTASLKDYRLTFTRWSKRRNCGVADVVPAAGKTVWGVVYQVPEEDLANLDRKEGYKPDRTAEKNAYNRCTATVLQNGDLALPLTVEIYFATPQEGAPFLPNQSYKNLIVNGALTFHLPDDYITELEQIEVAE